MRKLKIVILSINIIFILSIIIIFILTDCGYGKLTGIVIDKEYKQEYTTIRCMPIGKIVTTIPIHHPATWKLRIQKEENGKTKTTWVSVEEEYYNKVQIGDKVEL